MHIYTHMNIHMYVASKENLDFKILLTSLTRCFPIMPIYKGKTVLARKAAKL